MICLMLIVSSLRSGIFALLRMALLGFATESALFTMLAFLCSDFRAESSFIWDEKLWMLLCFGLHDVIYPKEKRMRAFLLMRRHKYLKRILLTLLSSRGALSSDLQKKLLNRYPRRPQGYYQDVSLPPPVACRMTMATACCS